MLKKDLIKEIEQLKSVLKAEQSRSTGHTVQNCNINMDCSDEVVAVAEAVEEGMKALQAISKQIKSAVYFEGTD